MESVGEFDFIVVGAGSAGCVAAARLAESGAYRVALLEAGGEDNSFRIHAPLGHRRLFDDKRYTWRYESEPEAELENARLLQPRGRVLGGTGSIDGMVYKRGQPEDFDYWRQLGNIGWGYDEVLPYFKKAEDNERGADAYHGAGGPLRVSNAHPHPLVDAFIAGAAQAGYSRNDDFNGATDEGFGYHQLMIRRGRRWSAADGYLHPARGRANLAVITGALATRLVIENGEAVAVEFMRRGKTQIARARRDIVLSLGAFNTPQLLQLSGVGPAPLLQSRGVPVVRDLPGVGRNLQDHFGPAITYRCARPVTVNDLVRNPLRRIGMGLDYLLLGRGPMTTNGRAGGGCVRTNPSLGATDVRLDMVLWSPVAGRARKTRLLPFSSFSVVVALQHPDSRGTVTIRSRDIAEPPEIRFNFFASPDDRRRCVETIRIVRRIMTMPAIAAYVAAELEPGPERTGEADLVAHCRAHGHSAQHGAGTCKMGVDTTAVVDPRLRVRGIGRLRVMDGSVMPRIVGADPNATIVMIAEKGAAMAVEDARGVAAA